jgi:hypothetical protein
MKHSPFLEASSHSASEEISQLLWNQKVRYHVHKSPAAEPDDTSPHLPTLFFQESV